MKKIKCPECGKEIRGWNEKMLEWNLLSHVQSHKRQKQKAKEKKEVENG